MEGPKFESPKDQEVIQSSRVFVNPEHNLAMIVVKPDAFGNKDEIIRRLEYSGLYVVGARTCQLPESFVVGAMYRGLPEGIQRETAKHFNSGLSEIILVKGGRNIVQDIVALSGEKFNPHECTEDSIRYIFGEHFGREAGDGKEYFRNAIHRPRDAQEQNEDLEKFRSLS